MRELGSVKYGYIHSKDYGAAPHEGTPVEKKRGKHAQIFDVRVSAVLMIRANGVWWRNRGTVAIEEGEGRAKKSVRLKFPVTLSY